MAEKESNPPSTGISTPLKEPGTQAVSLHDGDGKENRPVSPAMSKREVEGEGVGEPEISTDDMEYPKGFRLAAVVIALIISIFLVSLDMTIVATAIPRITDQFHSLDQVGWYGSAFFLTVASFQSTWGKAYKYFDLKVTFLIAIFIFEVGSLICGVANSSTTLIVGRAIAGAGGAGIASGVYTIIAFSAPPKQRPAFTGLLGATYGTASVIGPLLGGVFTDNLTWRWCFYINLPVGGASAAIILFTFKTPDRVKPVKASLREKLLQMDFIGTFTLMAAVVCYLLALQWGGVTKPWGNATVVGLLVGFVLLLTVFGIIQWYSGERAILQGRLLRKRIIIVGCLYVSFLGGAFFALLYYLPIYFQAVSGVSPSQSGIRNVPLVVSTSIFSILSGGLITVLGHYVPLMIISSIMTTIGTGLIYTLGLHSPSSHWIGYQVLTGAGIGFGFQIPVIVAQASVEPVDISAVTAVVLFFQTIGGSFFVSAGQAAFANRLLANLHVPGVSSAQVVATGASQFRSTFSAAQIPGILVGYLDGLRVVFALSVALAGISVLVALFAPWQRINAMAALGGA
ncbi:hypothetical protein MMC06_006631 [Schaereria dolodes]|nr:hypothetical protein [Schaereria dolodes]